MLSGPFPGFPFHNFLIKCKLRKFRGKELSLIAGSEEQLYFKIRHGIYIYTWHIYICIHIHPLLRKTEASDYRMLLALKKKAELCCPLI